MVRTAGLARMAGTAQTARTAWTVRTGWKIGQLGNWEIGKLENWEFSRWEVTGRGWTRFLGCKKELCNFKVWVQNSREHWKIEKGAKRS